MRRPQFSLKTMLWLVAVSGMLCVIVPHYITKYLDYVDAKRLDWEVQEGLEGDVDEYYFKNTASRQKPKPTGKPPTWWWPWPR